MTRIKIPALIFVSSFIVMFFSWFLLYRTGINKLAIQSEDTLPAMFIPISIIKDHTLYLDKYYDMLIERYPQPDDKDQLKGYTPYYLKKVIVTPNSTNPSQQIHYVSAFPLITPLLALPVYLLPVILNIPINWDNVILLSKISSVSIISLSGVFLYLLFRKRFELSERVSICMVGMYLFCTINFPLVSQALWQHGTVQLLLILSLYYLLGFISNYRKRDIFLFGMFSSLAFLTRPTALLPVFVMTFMLLYYTRNELSKVIPKIPLFLIGIILPLIFFFWYNSVYYLDIKNQGYSAQLTNSWSAPFPEGFFGVWLSPSKGILIYSSLFIFSFYGFYLTIKSIKKGVLIPQYIFYMGIVLIHTLVISFWKQWYGGWSFGYRMSSDVIPFMVLMLIPFIKSVQFPKYKKVLIFFVTLSLLFQFMGIIFFDGIWHAAYDKGLKNTSWLWSLKDSEVAFNIRRTLVKFGFMETALQQPKQASDL